jgi:hypothetical protein
MIIPWREVETMKVVSNSSTGCVRDRSRLVRQDSNDLDNGIFTGEVEAIHLADGMLQLESWGRPRRVSDNRQLPTTNHPVGCACGILGLAFLRYSLCWSMTSCTEPSQLDLTWVKPFQIDS